MTLAANDFVFARFSTDDLPERDRIPVFREVFGRAVVKLDLTPLAEGPFHHESVLRALPGASFATSVNSGICSERTRGLLADGNDDLLLYMLNAGDSLVSQHGQEATLGSGGAILMTGGDVGSLVLRTGAQSLARFTTVGVPRHAIGSMVNDPDAMIARPLQGNSGALRLLSHYLKVLEEDHALDSPQLRHTIVTHIHDLVALVIGATRDAADVARGRGVRAARLRAIKADITKNLGRGGLSVDSVAARQGVSPRYVRMLFESDGSTFSEFVLGQRLIRAHRMLTDPRSGPRTISVIAFECGFGDLSYFNRTFRRRFGMAPSDVRCAGLREPGR
jgi:AraC-like DNA-binding protein